MRRLSRMSIVGVAAAGLIITLGAAQRPAALSKTEGGLWELVGVARKGAANRICLREPLALAQIEHRGVNCTRVVLRDLPTQAEVHYTCPDGGFGRTTITAITPRLLRVDTQGISANAPFHYVLDARRTGKCENH